MYASALLHILKIFPKVIDLCKLRCQGGVQFVEQGRQGVPEQLVRLAASPPRWLNGESSKSSGSMLMAVAMWSRIKLSHAELFGAKLDAGFCLVHEPFVEPLGYGVGEGREDGLLFQRKADERDESHQSSHELFLPGSCGVPAHFVGGGPKLGFEIEAGVVRLVLVISFSHTDSVACYVDG